MPHWALKRRARELGLARTKEFPWSDPELEILARYAWMSDERIRLKLKAAGYLRTVTGIHLKLKRMKFKHDGSFYSAYGLAQALGIDPHAAATATAKANAAELKSLYDGLTAAKQFVIDRAHFSIDHADNASARNYLMAIDNIVVAETMTTQLREELERQGVVVPAQ